MKFSSDTEFAAVSIKKLNSEEIPVLFPPSLLMHRQKLTPVGERSGQSPHPIFYKDDNSEIYQDGALFETDFKPAKTAHELFRQFVLARENLNSLLAPLGLRSWEKPVAKFEINMLPQNEEWIIQSCIAGCSPDLDMIEDGYESKVRDLTDWPYRGLGAHLHISEPEFGDKIHRFKKAVVRMLAITVGNIAVYTNDSVELERKRREHFGAPGRCRFPVYPNGDYGVEYRSLSPTWLRSEEIIEQILEAAKFAITTAIELPKETESMLTHYLTPSTEAITNVQPEISKQILTNIGLI